MRLKPLDRAYKHRDATQLTIKDLQEMAEDFRNMEEEAAEIQQRIEDLQREQTVNEIKIAILETLADNFTEETKEGMLDAIHALRDYVADHPQTIHEFLTNPDLPKILEEIREGVVQRLQNDSKQPQKGPVPEGAPIWENDFMPIYNGDIVREFVQLTKGDFQPIEDESGHKVLTADTKKGPLAIIDPNGNSAFLESFGPLAIKLFDAGLTTFTNSNHYDKGPATNVRVDIDFLRFAEDQRRSVTAPEDATEEEKTKAKNRRNDFINEINRNLTDLSNFRWPLAGGRGDKLGIVQTSHWVRNNYITFFIDQGFADLVKQSGIIAQWPVSLLKISNKDPNAYKLGRAVANYHSNDRNAERGQESTLSVKSMITYAPTIPTFEHLRTLSKKGRDWRQKIKKPLEDCFSEFMHVGYWVNWQYRNPKTGDTYDQEQAARLPASDYEILMVDYTVKDAPNQDARRGRKLEERKKRQEAAEAAGKTPKKRGRPKKSAESV